MAEIQQPDVLGNYLSNYYAAQQQQQAQQDRQRQMQRQDAQDQYAETARRAEMFARDVLPLDTPEKWAAQAPQIAQKWGHAGEVPGFDQRERILTEAMSLKDAMELKIKERSGASGPFAGTGFEASSANIVVRGQSDPAVRSSPEYALAYSNLTQPRMVQDAAGRFRTYTPELPQGILPPISVGQQSPQQQGGMPAPRSPAATPQGGGRVPGTATLIPGLEAPSPIPSEVAARIGLARGFLERYDDILKKLPDVSTIKGRLQLIFNTGEGGEIKRHIETGMEALIRQLTGAGKSQEEATSYASRYAPGAFDTAFDTKSKLEGLKYDLTHSADEVMKGRGGFTVTPQGGQPQSNSASGWKIEIER